jgi:hypothetical protein
MYFLKHDQYHIDNRLIIEFSIFKMCNFVIELQLLNLQTVLRKSEYKPHRMHMKICIFSYAFVLERIMLMLKII